MLLLEIIVLAVVQGIAEFLPISSTGHVVVVAALFEQFGTAGQQITDTLTVNIVLHVGTLAAILVFYWHRIWRLLGQDRRVIGLILVGSIPAAVAGLWLKAQYGAALENPLLAGCMFPITGAMLLWTTRAPSGSLTCKELTYGKALVIGVLQAFAILPGISRSGSTIVAGLACGLKRDEAAAFSFLLAIPVIGGAGLLELRDLVQDPTGSTPTGLLMLGALVSFGVGVVALWWLVRWVEQGHLYRFAWWVLLLGPIVILWQLFGT